MKVWVINLEGSAQRWAAMRSQLDESAANYACFRAVEGSRGRRYFDNYCEKRFLINTGRRASAGEAGCYASHLCLWRKCVVHDTPIVIMEDDALLRSNFIASLTAAESVIEQCGFIRLQTDRPQSGRPGRAN